MSVLLMRLSGPMQSWGTQSRFTYRDTGREPSKSGIVGLICAACGIKRNNNKKIAEIAEMPMGVRVDQEGTVLIDYQTAGGTHKNDKKYGVMRASGKAGDTVVSHRYYLADAEFLVALDGCKELLENLYKGLTNPIWPIYLGRKSYIPSVPVYLPDGVIDNDIEDVLKSYTWLARDKQESSKAEQLRLILESDADTGKLTVDVPVSFKPREYKLRYVKTQWIKTDKLP